MLFVPPTAPDSAAWTLYVETYVPETTLSMLLLAANLTPQDEPDLPAPEDPTPGLLSTLSQDIMQAMAAQVAQAYLTIADQSMPNLAGANTFIAGTWHLARIEPRGFVAFPARNVDPKYAYTGFRLVYAQQAPTEYPADLPEGGESGGGGASGSWELPTGELPQGIGMKFPGYFPVDGQEGTIPTWEWFAGISWGGTTGWNLFIKAPFYQYIAPRPNQPYVYNYYDAPYGPYICAYGPTANPQLQDALATMSEPGANRNERLFNTSELMHAGTTPWGGFEENIPDPDLPGHTWTRWWMRFTADARIHFYCGGSSGKISDDSFNDMLNPQFWYKRAEAYAGGISWYVKGLRWPQDGQGDTRTRPAVYIKWPRPKTSTIVPTTALIISALAMMVLGAPTPGRGPQRKPS